MIISFIIKTYVAKLYERSQYDKANSQPWLITETKEISNGIYSFKSRDITLRDFDNIKSSLFNGQQVFSLFNFL